MNLLFDYPWLFVGPAFLVLSFISYARIAPLVDAGRVTSSERRRFAIGLTVSVLVVTGAAGVIQVVSNTRTFMCLAQFPPQSVAGSLVWSLQGLTAAALLYWLWFRNGADLLARVGPVLLQRNPTAPPYKVGITRGVLSAFVILGSLGGALQIMLTPSLLALYGCAQ